MSLSGKAPNQLNTHWAVSAIRSDDRERADQLVKHHLAKRLLKEQFTSSFEEQAKDERLLERVSLAYELAAIEGLDELGRPAGSNQQLRDQAMAASFRTFEFRCLLPVPNEANERMFFVLQLSAVAHCGDRWTDLQRWYMDREIAALELNINDTEWDRWVLSRLYVCWISLFRKQGQKELSQIGEIIACLREEQNIHEKRLLENGSKTEGRAIAFRLAALYNWAKATESLASYLLQGEPANPFGVLDRHFDAGINSASASGDAKLEITLRWLHPTARIMVAS